MSKLETILYEEDGKVAWVTLNRPDKYNAFNEKMQEELRTTWRNLRKNDDINVVVLTAAGNKAFCTGIDRSESMDSYEDRADNPFGTSNEFMYDDPGLDLGPKACDLWKPVICAVNGMACGGAFYMLGESDIIISADHATFFDPHTTFGMAAVFESVHMLQKMPFGEIMRVALTGSYERMTAKRAHEIGLVSEVVPYDELHDATKWLADVIASQPADAVQATQRVLWLAREVARSSALGIAPAIVSVGNKPKNMIEGQKVFSSGNRIEPKIR